MIPAILAAAMLACGAWAQTDGEAASVIKAANDAEIDAAQAALAKSQSEDVRAFADRMIGDHQKSNQEIAPFVPPGGTQTGQAQRLTDEAIEQERQLSALSGAAFDAAYVAAQAQDHGELVDILDRALGGGETRAPAFQELLRRTRTMAAAHLTQARQLQAQLRGR